VPANWPSTCSFRVDDLDLAVLRILFVLFCKLVGEDLEFRLSDGEFCSGLQLRKGKPVLGGVSGGQRGKINVGITPGEAWRDDADHREDLMVEFDCFADDVATSTKLALPKR